MHDQDCGCISKPARRPAQRAASPYGNRPLPIRAARIALRDKGPATVHGSDRKLTFDGSDGTVIAGIGGGGRSQFGHDLNLHIAVL